MCPFRQIVLKIGLVTQLGNISGSEKFEGRFQEK
jgi:hypothetical protein